MTADATGPAPQTIEDILAVADDPAYVRVVTARVPFVPQSLRDEHADLEAQLAAMLSDVVSDPDRVAVAERIVEIEDQIAASIREFRFVSIGRKAWSDLLAQHPPTDAQRRRDRGLDYNPDTFPYVAMAAACTSPVMTVDQARNIGASPALDVAGWSELWGACIRANVQAEAPKSMAAGLTLRASSRSAATAFLSASPDPSSSAE